MGARACSICVVLPASPLTPALHHTSSSAQHTTAYSAHTTQLALSSAVHTPRYLELQILYSNPEHWLRLTLRLKRCIPISVSFIESWLECAKASFIFSVFLKKEARGHARLCRLIRLCSPTNPRPIGSIHHGESGPFQKMREIRHKRGREVDWRELWEWDLSDARQNAQGLGVCQGTGATVVITVLSHPAAPKLESEGQSRTARSLAS